LQHGTCPVCRRYYCAGELHLPLERVSLFRSILRRVCRIICSPLIYFFPSIGYAQLFNDRHRPTPMYRLMRAERVTMPPDLFSSDSFDEIMEDYIFCHVMFVLQNVDDERYPGLPNAMAAEMRRRFSRLHREANINPAEDENPPPERPEFHFPPDILSAEYLGHY